MAHGGKVNFRENYTPTRDTGLEGPYARTTWETFDLVLVWLSGLAVGVAATLIATGN
jgi:hypothetical protein